MAQEQISQSGLLAGKNKKIVFKFDFNLKFIEEYESATVAAKVNNVTKPHLCNAAKSGCIKKCGGYFWSYKKEEDNSSSNKFRKIATPSGIAEYD